MKTLTNYAGIVGNFDFHSDTIVTFTSPLSPDSVRKTMLCLFKKDCSQPFEALN
jgi:hypothetical protein